jgi:uncharacterized protein
MSCIRFSENFLLLDIKAVPGSSKTELGKITDNRLKVRIAAAPEDGKANEELRSFLAKLLDLPKRDVIIQSGEKSKLKTLQLPLSAKEKLELWQENFKN